MSTLETWRKKIYIYCNIFLTFAVSLLPFKLILLKNRQYICEQFDFVECVTKLSTKQGILKDISQEEIL
jgi:hypothetical protein